MGSAREPPLATVAVRRPSPLLAFAELRARLLVRRLRGRGGIPELVARIALFAVAIPAGLGFAPKGDVSGLVDATLLRDLARPSP